MPELPEVEVTRRGIDPRLRGAQVLAVHVGKPLRRPLGREVQALVGLRLGAVQRRGKYLWLPLQGAPDLPAQGLLIHLGMSGSLRLLGAPAPPEAHEHFRLDTDHGSLRLHDPRRFGAVVWSAALDHEPAAGLLSGLGFEPFDAALTDERFHAALQQRRAPIKSVLLGGRVIVGAGNIYACEALFHAGIDPRCSAARIGRARAARLLQAVRQTLAQAMTLGGSTLRDFRDAHGVNGSFQQQAAVYGREGEPCKACGTPLRRIVQGQRSSYFCPRCQRR
ncbi:MAG TPA: bifunctional DNA-formamidopyrimidine glycosylase/DNA-(apurinic or apyrimidinic site) lyase [Rubrivivax sp.]|nr:bifunctional DNA-formamidopyrimidine glycosylase/DNA-(apurinic or apyrimidinic site) lyase [Burkholderiales bacterium]HNT39634.1 bifunctional DNA-formamidopyrimidine glycosylase/DNA-(apurinic or apyrimidinic site) lyase [Rubrivivax sp.]